MKECVCAFLLQFNILLCSYADNLIIFVFGNNVIYVLPIFSSHSLFNLNIFSFSLITYSHFVFFLLCSSDLCCFVLHLLFLTVFTI